MTLTSDTESTKTKISNKIKTIIAVGLLVIIAAVIYTTLYIAKQEREAELPKMTVQEKKARFKSLIVPAVHNVHSELMSRYEEVKSIIDKRRCPMPIFFSIQ